MSALPEKLCPRCGAGMVSGHQYPSCVDFPTRKQRRKAHAALCRSFARGVCGSCRKDMRHEDVIDLPDRRKDGHRV